MRSSSIKFLTVVTTLAVTLTFVAPRAEARPAASREKSNRGVIASVTQLVQRFFGVRTNGELPSDPIPVVQKPNSGKGTPGPKYTPLP